MDLLLLGAAFLVILLGAELFTNGIEWLGRRLDLGEGAVGSVLAAVGTALPETMIPLVAILFVQSGTADAVGIGAILGAPFMLATLALFVTGAAVLGFRRRRAAGALVSVNLSIIRADVRAFLGAYTVAIGAAFLPPGLVPAKWGIAAFLMLLYARHVHGHFTAEAGAGDGDLAPLRLRHLDRAAHRGRHEPRLAVIVLQVFVALAGILVGAAVFVGAVEQISRSLGIDETLLALVIAPIATELPEKLNSVIWVRQGKDTLALGNITGAMVFQSAFPVSVALLFAPDAWSIGPGTLVAFLSAGIAVASLSTVLVLPMRRPGDPVRAPPRPGRRLVRGLPRDRRRRHGPRRRLSGPGPPSPRRIRRCDPTSRLSTPRRGAGAILGRVPGPPAAPGSHDLRRLRR